MRYKGVIFTNHILERMQKRGITRDYAYWTFYKPDRQLPSKNKGFRFYRGLKDDWFVVVGVQNEHQEWVLKTCWTQPKHHNKVPHAGSLAPMGWLRYIWYMLVGR